MVKYSPYADLVIPETPVTNFILEKIKHFGDDVAMVDSARGNSITFRQLHEQVVKCASALYKRGLRKGDVVALCATNRVEYPVVLFAVAACGGTTTVCNPVHTEGEICQKFKLSSPKMVFCEPNLVQSMKNIASEIPSLKKIFTFGIKIGSTSYDDLVRGDDGKDYPAVAVDPKKNVFLLSYSSGTTGLPKGVMLTHYYIIAQLVLMQFIFYTCRSSCFYMVVPMCYSFGYSLMLCQLAHGVKIVFDSRFEMGRMLRAFEKYGVTHASAVPPILIKLAQTEIWSKYNTSSLQRMITAGAPIATNIVASVEEKYKVIVSAVYGLTESAPLTTNDPVVRNMNSVGTIAPNTMIKITDPETGTELGPGRDGEILAKAPMMMKGYLGNVKATAETIDSEGWLHTGDIGHYDKNGMLYIVGRQKELIKYKGFQVAPAELEALLLTHPAISDAAVIGIVDAEAGEHPKAFVVKNNSSLKEEDVRQFVTDKVSHWKRLRGGVEFIDAIPKSASGKILRGKLQTRPYARSRI